MTILEKLERNARIEELEEALTDALYAWGLVQTIAEEHSMDSGWPWQDKRDYEEAEERIQRARLALPKAQNEPNSLINIG